MILFSLIETASIRQLDRIIDDLYEFINLNRSELKVKLEIKNILYDKSIYFDIVRIVCNSFKPEDLIDFLKQRRS